ncbi:hypothetical protein RA983_21245, partial [Mycobacteroides abscessus subsp. abscessus]
TAGGADGVADGVMSCCIHGGIELAGVDMMVGPCGIGSCGTTSVGVDGTGTGRGGDSAGILTGGCSSTIDVLGT